MTVKDKAVFKRLHDEAGMCEIPQCALPAIECHHILGRGAGGGTRLDLAWNLVVLCAGCHRAAQAYQLVMQADGVHFMEKAEQRRYLWGLAAEREIFRMLRIPKKNK